MIAAAEWEGYNKMKRWRSSVRSISNANFKNKILSRLAVKVRLNKK